MKTPALRAGRAFGVAAACLIACTAAPTTAPSTPSVSPTITAPSPSTPAGVAPVSVAVIGDWGAGTDDQRAVGAEMCELRRNDRFRIVVTTGDNFYDPDGTATQGNYHDPMACLLQAGIEWRASWGNHDVRGDATREVLGAKRWYRWRFRGADFFMLDSNNTSDAEQKAWLERALAASNAAIKVAVFHHPPYTVGSQHDPDQNVQREWVPLFRQHGVRLVLTGHNHIYEHHVVDGIHYVVTGGGGRSLYGCARTTPELVRCDEVHHFLLLSVRGTTVTIRAIRANGTTLDRFQIA